MKVLNLFFNITSVSHCTARECRRKSLAGLLTPKEWVVEGISHET